MSMFTCSSDASNYVKSQRILALAAIIEALKGDINSRENDLRYAAVGELRCLLGVA